MVQAPASEDVGTSRSSSVGIGSFQEIAALTSMRGIVALWVLAFHIEIISGARGQNPVIASGYLGVEFFFMLSGYILSASYGPRFRKGLSAADYLDFVLRRARRLYPVHWAVLSVIILVAYFEGRASGAYAEFRELSLTNMWAAHIPRLNGPDWSISTELAANLVFPFIALMALGASLRASVSAVALALLCVAGLIHNASQNQWSLDTIDSWPAMNRCACEFALGMMLFRWRQKLLLLSTDFGLILIFVAVIALVALGMPDLLAVAFMAPGIAGLANNTGTISGVLSLKPFRWLGKISFSIYLVQVPILQTIKWLMGPLTSVSSLACFAAGSIAAILCVSQLTYHHIEERFRRGIRVGVGGPGLDGRRSGLVAVPLKSA